MILCARSGAHLKYANMEDGEPCKAEADVEGKWKVKWATVNAETFCASC